MTDMVPLAGASLGLLGLYLMIDHVLFKPHRTSYILRALFKHFELRKEHPIEFPISVKTAKRSHREFEVKTNQQKYYLVVIQKLKVTHTEQIHDFTIGENDWYMRGKVDPMNLSQFSIAVREKLGEAIPNDLRPSR